MRIRALCAAAAVAVGVGSAADAATTYGFKYIETVYVDVTIYQDNNPDDEDDYEIFEFVSLSNNNDSWGLGLFIPNMKPGDIFTYKDIRSDCILTDTCKYLEYYYEDPLYFGEELWMVEFPGGLNKGSIVDLWDADTYVGHHFYGDNFQAIVHDRHTYFEIVEIAPVPLPATAALLPLGIGALAMMRGRRRALS